MQTCTIGAKLLDLGNILLRIDESADVNVEALAQMPYHIERSNLFSLVGRKGKPLG